MSLYRCAKCECVENTALGLYWSKNYPDIFLWSTENYQYKGRALCSACAPAQYNDGKPTKYGKWHGKFPKQHVSEFPPEIQKEIE